MSARRRVRLIKVEEAVKRSFLAALLAGLLAYRLTMVLAASPSEEMTVGPIRVTSVDVQVSDLQAGQVYAHVRGVIGDSCTEALPVQQTREGNTVTLTLNRQRPAQAICSKIAKVLDENIRLLGEFPPGEYILSVNTVERKFRVP